MSAWGQAAKSCNTLLTRTEQNDPTLVDLVILPSKTFGDTELDRLSNALLTNTWLKSVSASGHTVSPDALRRFGKAIIQSSPTTNLIKIAIGGSSMGDDGVIAFCEGLESDVDDANKTDSSSSTLTLQHLDLEYKGISALGMKALGKTLFGSSSTTGATNHPSSSLQHLNLARNEDIGDEGILEFCKETSSTISFLETLDLSECNIGSKGATALANCLRRNNKNNNSEDNADDNGHGRRLNLLLNSNPLGPIGFGSFFVRSSSSSTTEACDDEPSTNHMNNNSIFSSLLVQNCEIGNEGILHLAKAIQEGHAEESSPSLSSSSLCCMDGLKILDLSNNQIGPLGIQAFAETLVMTTTTTTSTTYWKNLSDIRLAGNPLEVQGVTSLVQVLTQRNDTTTSSIGNSSDENNKNNNENDIVKSLDLCLTNAGKQGAAAALRCGSLTSLRLFNNKLGSQEGFQELSPLLYGGHPSLVNLDLGGNSETEENVLLLLESIKKQDSNFESKLRVLELGGNDGGFAIEDIIEELKQIRPELDIARDRPRKDPNAGESKEENRGEEF